MNKLKKQLQDIKGAVKLMFEMKSMNSAAHKTLIDALNEALEMLDIDNINLNEILVEKVKSIAETYHDRVCMSSLFGSEQVCKCCGNVVSHTTSIEHDSMDFSKDLLVCIDCYAHIVNYWINNKSGKIAPI